MLFLSFVNAGVEQKGLGLAYLRPLQFVATEKPVALRRLAMPRPISPIDRMPIVAKEVPLAAMFRAVCGSLLGAWLWAIMRWLSEQEEKVKRRRRGRGSYL